MLEGRIYWGLRGEDGRQYIPIIRLPGKATAHHAKEAQTYLRAHRRELDALTTVAAMRAWWAAQGLPATWELSFERWRGPETEGPETEHETP